MVSQRFFVLAALAFLLSVVPACNSSGPNEPNRGVTIEKVSGDKISAVFGTGITPTVRVQRDGEPEAGVNVKFSVVSGGGTVANWEVRTDENGVASTLWLLGATTGNQVLRASLAGESAYFTATAAVPQVGTSYFGRNNYVEYIPGELPIILSSPHDGPLTPSEIPDRTWGTTGRDLNTMDLTRRIASALQRLTGKRPYVAINHLRRIKLDPNREIVEAAQGSRYSEFAWHQYHTWIDMARDEITKKYGTGLLLDIHGHSHEIKRVEVGYMLNSSDLNRSDSQLDATQYITKSSIRHLGTTSPLRFSQLVRGDDSLGQIMVRNGLRAIPSKAEPRPENDPFLSSGYTLQRHGRDSGTFNAIMLEHDSEVRSSATSREAYANALAKSVVEFVAKHMNIDMTQLEPAGVP